MSSLVLFALNRQNALADQGVCYSVAIHALPSWALTKYIPNFFNEFYESQSLYWSTFTIFSKSINRDVTDYTSPHAVWVLTSNPDPTTETRIHLLRHRLESELNVGYT